MMKFEITYADASKVIVEVPNAAILEWLDGRAKSSSAEVAAKVEIGRGAPTKAKIVP
jgi:hypothetical protein